MSLSVAVVNQSQALRNFFCGLKIEIDLQKNSVNELIRKIDFQYGMGGHGKKSLRFYARAMANWTHVPYDPDLLPSVLPAKYRLVGKDTVLEPSVDDDKRSVLVSRTRRFYRLERKEEASSDEKPPIQSYEWSRQNKRTLHPYAVIKPLDTYGGSILSAKSKHADCEAPWIALLRKALFRDRCTNIGIWYSENQKLCGQSFRTVQRVARCLRLGLPVPVGRGRKPELPREYEHSILESLRVLFLTNTPVYKQLFLRVVNEIVGRPAFLGESPEASKKRLLVVTKRRWFRTFMEKHRLQLVQCDKPKSP